MAARGLRGPSRRSGASAAQERARQPAGRAGQDVSQRAPKERRAPAQPAPTNWPAARGKISAPPVASAARGRLREPTQRRKLTSRERVEPQSGRHPGGTVEPSPQQRTWTRDGAATGADARRLLPDTGRKVSAAAGLGRSHCQRQGGGPAVAGSRREVTLERRVQSVTTQRTVKRQAGLLAERPGQPMGGRVRCGTSPEASRWEQAVRFHLDAPAKTGGQFRGGRTADGRAGGSRGRRSGRRIRGQRRSSQPGGDGNSSCLAASKATGTGT